MRVPTISLYSKTTYQLNGLTTDLSDANEVMATQKQINSISDDPIGMAQVLGIQESLDSLEQYSTNIDMGITWLNGVEESLDSVQEQILEMKTLCLQLANASVSASERADAVETIEGKIDQILNLMNTQVNGSYIFGGTDTNTIPFAYDDPDNPTSVIYLGNSEAFTITNSETSQVEVGRDGSEVLTEDRIIVDSTNNKIFFEEDPGDGENAKVILEATIPDGDYTKEELAVVVQNAMTRISTDEGYGVTYMVSYDADADTFSFINDGAYEGYMGFTLLWESGEDPQIGNITTDGILLEGVDIELVDGNALIYETPEPDGTAPVRLTWDEDDGVWNVVNDPGYNLPLQIDGSDSHVELDLTGNGVADIVINLESAAEDGGYIEFDITAASNEQSIGPDMGFTSDVSYTPPLSDSAVVLKSFDSTNNVIDFIEVTSSGTSSQLSAAIPAGDYSNMETLAATIETAMERASANDANYEVTYSWDSGTFTIEEAGTTLTELQLLWGTGTNAVNSAASQLGFDPIDDITPAATGYTGDNQVALFTITADSNDKINFKEILPGLSGEDVSELTATIPAGTYYDTQSFARAVEDALEDASAADGNRVDYDVTYDYNSGTFSIEEDGTLGRKLEDFQLLWKSGSDAGESAAQVLGFSETDVSATPIEGDTATWGIFETLFDLKEYLASDDVDGIQRTLTRLDNHYNSITSTLADTGIKYNRLEVSQQVILESTNSLTERKSMIEDADYIEATMNLTAIQTAYEASLNSTAKIINVSLVDYL